MSPKLTDQMLSHPLKKQILLSHPLKKARDAPGSISLHSLNWWGQWGSREDTGHQWSNWNRNMRWWHYYNCRTEWKFKGFKILNQIKEEERNPDPTSCHPPKPYPTTLGYTSFITSVPKWKVKNHVIELRDGPIHFVETIYFMCISSVETRPK